MNIENKLNEILKTVANVDINDFPNEAKNFPLLSSRFNIQPHEMVSIYLKIESGFGIEISDSEIENGKFNSYNNILEIIKQQLDYTE